MNLSFKDLLGYFYFWSMKFKLHIYASGLGIFYTGTLIATLVKGMLVSVRFGLKLFILINLNTVVVLWKFGSSIKLALDFYS